MSGFGRVSLRRRLAVGIAVGALAVGGAAAPAGATDTDGPNNATVLASKAYPGIQLIATTYTATVSVPSPQINQAALSTLIERLILQAATGVIGTSEAEITEAMVDAIVKAPDTYFRPSARTYSESATLTGVGTGWVITPDGYIVTAAHVVSADPAELTPAFAQKALTKLSNAFLRGLQSGGTNFTRDQVSRLNDVVTTWFAEHMSVTDLSSSVSALVAQGSVVQGKKQEVVPAEVIDQGVPYPGNDVALLKIDGVENMPTMELGSDDDVSEGSTLHVVGYPAASTFSRGFSAGSQVQPTVTEGPVTAIKVTSDDMPVFQTQAPASPGNSGGPVLDDDAKVVGVLVASAVGDDGVALEGQEFVIPVSVVSEMLDDNSVEPETSDTSASYNEALDEYYQNHFKAALPLFQDVEELYPDHPYVGKFIDETNAGIANGEDETPAAATKDEGGGLPGWLIPAVGGLVLLGLLSGVVVLLLKRRSSGAAAAPPASYPGQQQPQQGYQQPQQAYQPQYDQQTAPYPQRSSPSSRSTSSLSRRRATRSSLRRRSTRSSPSSPRATRSSLRRRSTRSSPSSRRPTSSPRRPHRPRRAPPAPPQAPPLPPAPFSQGGEHGSATPPPPSPPPAQP